MPIEGQFILVIDPSPEAAAGLNSQLRNAGLSVQVLHADSSHEAARLGREFRPVLVVHGADGPVSLHETASLANELQTFFAVTADQDNLAGRAGEVLQNGGMLIQSGNDDRMVSLCRRLLGAGAALRRNDQRQGDIDELRAQLALVLETTKDPITYFHEGLHVAANAAYLDLLGVDQFGDLAGTSLLEIVQAEDLDLKRLIRDLGDGQFPPEPIEARIKPRQDESVAVSLRFDPARLDHEDCIQMLVNVHEAASTEVAQSETAAEAAVDEAPVAEAPVIEALVVETPEPEEVPSVEAPAVPAVSNDTVPALADPVTGLLFRADFVARVDSGVSGSDEPARGAVLFVAADQHASLFDDLTVAEMDHLVKGISSAISDELHDDELACRFGDATFAVYALRENRAGVEALAERLREAVKRKGTSEAARSMPRPCSVGVAMFDPYSQDAETALAHARDAWHTAVQTGDTVVRYKPARGELTSENHEAAWVERIRYALDNDDFFTIQHNIMHLEGEGETLFENRTVMHDDAVDDSDPDYQGAAERNGLASRIDRLVIPGLLRAIDGGTDRHIISISGNSLQDFSFPGWFRRQLQESGVAGERVFLQLESGMARDHTKAARRLMDELANTGCGFSLSAMDDSNRKLALIDALNPELVRLDPVLTEELGQRTELVDRVRRVVSEAANHSCSVYVNNVRSSSDLALLWQCGVKLVTGDFLEGKPKVIGE
ncbi:EAL domain-containing protein [Marinihelvus fidelis]|uniref:EAL domain-containing protein n=1 Tax=Marinihelvus fidelis TaxID=2613842 RepID=A0A5N0TA84_9GAMM|nr:EAL domain-containing protein [Marinihelvus fidelis]KAA9131872.1 EAL domain-containing protein [Marinihelvus fidelis]